MLTNRKTLTIAVFATIAVYIFSSSISFSKHLNDIRSIRSCDQNTHGWPNDHTRLPPPMLRTDVHQLKKKSSENYASLSILEATAMAKISESQNEGLSHSLASQIHYASSKFHLSIARSSTVQFTVHSAENVNKEWVEPYESLTDRIVCNMDRVNSLNMNHIPHFSQVAFPCWSILHQFPNAERYVKLRNFDWEDITSEWITDLMQVFNDAGIQVIDYTHNDDKNQSKDRSDNSKIAISSQVWIANIQKPSGGFPKKGADSKSKIENCRYFVNRMDDVQSLQKRVLGADYNPSKNDNVPLRVLLLDRKGGTREWPFANSTAAMIEKEWGDKVFVDIVSHFEGSLHDQALQMHRADVIISPHGAQNTNLAFIRPCTSVLELFPHGYYLGYFQPLVLSAGGVAFDGYPYNGNKMIDTVSTISDLDRRIEIRKKPINASPLSILRVLPDLVISNISCRRARAYKDG